MSLLYRAVWNDEGVDPIALLDQEFKAWCVSKGVASKAIPLRGRLDVNADRWIDVRRADAELGGAVQYTLAERDNRGRVWTTTATALTDHSTRTFWVDLDCDDPSGGQPEMAAPRVVRGLLGAGVQPVNFGRPVQASAHRVTPNTVHDLAAFLLDPDRLAPVVIFSPELKQAPKVTVARADAAAEALAGLAQVYVAGPKAMNQLNAALPDGFAVYGGAVRLYLPGLDPDDPDDSSRHRWIPLRLIATHPRRAASMLASRLARMQLHPPIPDAWSRLEMLLRRPTEAEVGQRIELINAQRAAEGPRAVDADALSVEVEELTRRLAEVDLIREENERLAEARLARLEHLVRAYEEQQYDDADELEQLRRDLDNALRTVRLIARDEDSPVDDDPAELPTPGSITEAIEYARTYLPYVVLPDDALVDIDELEATAKYAVWGAATWQGLLALNEFAALKARGEPQAGFKLWCEQTGVWPASKLAMTESDTVQDNKKFRSQRSFSVAREVAEDGRVHMFSHLKIQAGGGDNIPRLYFHDDTDGATGKIHVGFLGPHRHVRNTRS